MLCSTQRCSLTLLLLVRTDAAQWNDSIISGQAQTVGHTRSQQQSLAESTSRIFAQSSKLVVRDQSQEQLVRTSRTPHDDRVTRLRPSVRAHSVCCFARRYNQGMSTSIVVRSTAKWRWIMCTMRYENEWRLCSAAIGEEESDKRQSENVADTIKCCYYLTSTNATYGACIKGECPSFPGYTLTRGVQILNCDECRPNGPAVEERKRESES